MTALCAGNEFPAAARAAEQFATAAGSANAGIRAVPGGSSEWDSVESLVVPTPGATCPALAGLFPHRLRQPVLPSTERSARCAPLRRALPAAAGFGRVLDVVYAVRIGVS